MRILARLIFYPTLLWNLLQNRINKKRRWWDWIDESVLLGALPFESHVAELKALGIGAVVNTCEEYCGPQAGYKAAGIEQLYIPTIDFTPPTLQDIEKSVTFIHAQIAMGKKVYIHCKAGRGRSATVAVCYLISKGFTAIDAQKLLTEKRPHVMPDVYKREVVQAYVANLRNMH